MELMVILKIRGIGSVAELVVVVSLLYSHVIFLCRQLGSELKMVMVQHHRLHLHLQLVHRGVCDQKMRRLRVLVIVVLALGLVPDVGVVEQPVKPW